MQECAYDTYEEFSAYWDCFDHDGECVADLHLVFSQAFDDGNDVRIRTMIRYLLLDGVSVLLWCIDYPEYIEYALECGASWNTTNRLSGDTAVHGLMNFQDHPGYVAIAERYLQDFDFSVLSHNNKTPIDMCYFNMVDLDEGMLRLFEHFANVDPDATVRLLSDVLDEPVLESVRNLLLNGWVPK